MLVQLRALTDNLVLTAIGVEHDDIIYARGIKLEFDFELTTELVEQLTGARDAILVGYVSVDRSQLAIARVHS